MSDDDLRARLQFAERRYRELDDRNASNQRAARLREHRLLERVRELEERVAGLQDELDGWREVFG